jgi:hypothetical protein
MLYRILFRNKRQRNAYRLPSMSGVRFAVRKGIRQRNYLQVFSQCFQ